MSETMTLEQGRAELRRLETEARTLRVKADQLKDGKLAAGVDILGNKDEFNAIDEAYKAADDVADKAVDMRSRITRLAEIEAARHGRGPSEGFGGGGGEDRAARRRGMRLGARVTDSEAYQAVIKRLGGAGEAARAGMIVAALNENPIELLSRDEFGAYLEFLATTVTGGGSTSAGPFIQNDLQAGFVPYARKRPVLASIVGQGETDSDVVEYVTQSAPTDAAAETAEDTQASESAYAFATQTTNVREITHSVPVTLRAMEDFGQLRTIVENQLLAGNIDRLDTQLASGGGTGQDLTGIYNASSIGTQPKGGDSYLDALHKAITQIRVAAGVLGEPDYIGMYPTDWQSVRIAKDDNGGYLMGPAGMAGDRAIWGIPVVVSKVFTSGQPLVGDFGGSATLWRRNALTVTAGLDGNDFTKRRMTLLAAQRIAFAVTRPGGFCVVTGF